MPTKPWWIVEFISNILNGVSQYTQHNAHTPVRPFTDIRIQWKKGNLHFMELCIRKLCDFSSSFIFHHRMCVEVIVISRQAEKERFNNNKEKNLSQWWNEEEEKILRKCFRFLSNACTIGYNIPKTINVVSWFWMWLKKKSIQITDHGWPCTRLQY